MESAGEGKREEAQRCPSLGGGLLLRSRLLRRAPEVRSAPGDAGASPSRGGLMVWGWWGTVGKERERRGEIPPGWSGGMRSPGAMRGDRALSPVLEPRRQKWLRVGARCWSWASSVPQPPPVTACPWHRGVWGRPTAPVGCACAAPHGTAPSPFWESLRCSGSVAY